MEGETREQLVDNLLSGYDALSTEAKLLFEQRRELENKLAWAKQQYHEVLKRFAPDVASTENQTFLTSLEEAGSCQQNGVQDWIDALSIHEDPDRRTRARSIRQARNAYAQLRAWPMEQDFTTSGTPSKLGCPFVRPAGRKMSSHAASVYERHSLTTPRSSISRLSVNRGRGMASRRTSFHDPIAGETCTNLNEHTDVGAPPSIEGSTAAVCPIRFLDQHSPEEVAKYFENHKHEIPRSHEICVKRYQSNAESIRQLDAKYGNLVSMIQGLGVKHQNYLPADPDPDADEEEIADSSNRVRNWAARVSDSLQADSPEKPVDDERQPHFDRPLRDVRVGESPSRPWGIHVPDQLDEDDPPIDIPVIQEPDPEEVASPSPAAPPARKCPFDHTKFGGGQPPPHPVEEERRPPEPVVEAEDKPMIVQPPSVAPYNGPPMVFNGPVFIGLSMDQALELLKQSKSA